MDAVTNFLIRIAPSLMEWALILFPLALYLIWLGFDVCRRRRPVVFTGVRDTAFLALALSGFFLLGTPTWLLNRYAHIGWKSYVVGYTLYLVVLGGIVWVWLRARRQSLVIYCIEPDAFPPLMRRALEQSGEGYQITPGRIALAANKLVIDLDASPSLYCVTLRWVGDPALWGPLESRLRSGLEGLETRNNPAGAILPLWAGLALMYCSLSTVLFVWYRAFMAM